VAGAGQQHGQAEAHEGERGLGVLGEAQLVVVGAGEEVAEVDFGGLRAPVTELGHLGIREQAGAHAGVLGALPGVEEGDLHGFNATRTTRSPS